MLNSKYVRWEKRSYKSSHFYHIALGPALHHNNYSLILFGLAPQAPWDWCSCSALGLMFPAEKCPQCVWRIPQPACVCSQGGKAHLPHVHSITAGSAGLGGRAGFQGAGSYLRRAHPLSYSVLKKAAFAWWLRLNLFKKANDHGRRSTCIENHTRTQTAGNRPSHLVTKRERKEEGTEDERAGMQGNCVSEVGSMWALCLGAFQVFYFFLVYHFAYSRLSSMRNPVNLRVTLCHVCMMSKYFSTLTSLFSFAHFREDKTTPIKAGEHR